MAEKVPEFFEAELETPAEPGVVAGETLVLADWMAVVTAKFRVDEGTHSGWMHLMRQPAAIGKAGESSEEQEWNQANPSDADSRQRERRRLALGKLCRTRQVLATPQVGLPQEEEVV
jgi:hypothetical protein